MHFDQSQAEPTHSTSLNPLNFPPSFWCLLSHPLETLYWSEKFITFQGELVTESTKLSNASMWKQLYVLDSSVQPHTIDQSLSSFIYSIYSPPNLSTAINDCTYMTLNISYYIHNNTPHIFYSCLYPSHIKLTMAVHSRGGHGPLKEKMEVQTMGVSIELSEKAAYLVWEDLTVVLPNLRESERRKILSGLSGYAQLGGTMAIMGPSGSGKSTLLDSLAGIVFIFSPSGFYIYGIFSTV